MVFLTHFQLPIHNETKTKFLTSLRQSTSTHIYDHIHEFPRQQRLIKTNIPYQLLVDWLTKSIFPPISRDVYMGGVIIEEHVINHGEYLEFAYS